MPEGVGMSGTVWSSQRKEEGWLKGRLREGRDCQRRRPSALTAPELLCPPPSALTLSTAPYLRAVERGGGTLGFGSSSQAAGRGPQAALARWLGGGDLAQKFAGGRLEPQRTENWALVDVPCTCPPGRGQGV